MKSTILITCVLACAWQLPAQGASKPAAKKQESAPATATADGQAEAIRKHPELGKTGSSFNVEFISRVKRYQKETPDFFKDPAWPMKLADEVAESGKVAGPGQKAPGNAGASKTAPPAGSPASLDKPRWIGKAKAGGGGSTRELDLKGDLFVSVAQEGPDNPTGIAKISGKDGTLSWMIQRSDIHKEAEGSIRSFLHQSGDLIVIGKISKTDVGEDHFVARTASANGKVMWTQILHIIVDDFHPSLFHSMDPKGDLYFGGLTSTSPLNKNVQPKTEAEYKEAAESKDGVVVKLDASSGKEVWRCSDLATAGKEDYVWRVNAESSGNVFVLISGKEGEIAAIGSSDGKLRWRASDPVSWHDELIVTKNLVTTNSIPKVTSYSHEGKKLWDSEFHLLSPSRTLYEYVIHPLPSAHNTIWLMGLGYKNEVINTNVGVGLLRLSDGKSLIEIHPANIGNPIVTYPSGDLNGLKYEPVKELKDTYTLGVNKKSGKDGSALWEKPLGTVEMVDRVTTDPIMLSDSAGNLFVCWHDTTDGEGMLSLAKLSNQTGGTVWHQHIYCNRNGRFAAVSYNWMVDSHGDWIGNFQPSGKEGAIIGSAQCSPSANTTLKISGANGALLWRSDFEPK